VGEAAFCAATTPSGLGLSLSEPSRYRTGMSQTPPPGYPPQGYGPQGYPQQQPLRVDEERLWGLLCHLSYFVFGIIAPIIIMLTLGNRSQYVRYHAVEALNFHITLWIAGLVSALLILVLIGIVLLPVVLLVGAIFSIIAGIQAYQGQYYRYPLTLRLIS
jgi:uncharacterized Tic20 family protein